jgi:RNA polymerase sigma factor (sigma-70 family)
MTLTINPHASERRAPQGDVARLVRAAAAGDEAAWNRLVESYSGLVWAIARSHRLSDADAADAAQATWLRLLEHLGDLHDPDRVGAWLATTVRRECLRVLRAGNRELPGGDDLPERVDPGPGVDDALLTGERDAALWAAFGRLRPGDLALLRLLMADPQPSYEEISTALDMPIGSIGPTRARALERLRAELSRDAIESAAAL